MVRLFALLAAFGLAAAETGIDGWLRYAPFPGASSHVGSLPNSIVSLNKTKSSVVYTAAGELQDGLAGIFNKTVAISTLSCPSSSAIVVGTVAQWASACGSAPSTPALEEDGFYLSTTGSTVQIIGSNERGALYGAFEYLSMLAQGNLTAVAYASNPTAPIRYVRPKHDYTMTYMN